VSLFLGTLASAHADQPQPAPWVQPREQDLRLLEVRLEQHIVADVINAYQHPGGALVPLGELSRLLGLAITSHPEDGTADGFILANDRRFFLDVSRREVTIEGSIRQFDPGLVEVHQDDIYVDSNLLSRWLPLRLEVDLFASVIYVHPTEPLPFQTRLEREKRIRRTRARLLPEDPGYPRREAPYQLWESPFIDQTVKLKLRRDDQGNETTDVEYTTYMTGDLFRLESAWYVAGNNDEPVRDFRLTLGRKDPQAELLGPLGAREFAFGDVTAPGLDLVSQARAPGMGFLVSSYPLTRQSRFDRHTFRGDLPPGWDVELYHNDALLDYRASREDGQYNFDDVPLVFGTNYFRLVFYGPYGQQRVEEHRFILGESLTPPGQRHYRVATQETEDGKKRTVLQMDLGLKKRLSTSFGLANLELDDGQHRYFTAGLRSSFQSMFLHADVARDSGGGTASKVGLQTRVWRINAALAHSRLTEDFSSELFEAGSNPLRNRTELNLNTAIPPTFLPRLPITLDVQRDRYYSGSSRTRITNRIFAFHRGLSVANQVLWDKQSDSDAQFTGSLRVSRFLGRYGLRGQLFYDLKPEREWTSLDLSFEGPLRKGYRFNAGFNRSFESSVDQYTLGLTKTIGSYALGIEARHVTNGELAVDLTFLTGLGREPRRSEWIPKPHALAGSGAASVRVFLDNNLNGTLDEGDQPLKGVRVTVDGGQHKTGTDADGITFIRDLPVYRPVNLSLAPETLEDPLWVPQLRGLKFTPRPGTTLQADFPVFMTGEVDGTVYLEQRGYLRELGDVEVELVDQEGAMVRRGKSAFDGFFVLSTVPPGDYLLRAAPGQLEHFKLTATPAQEVTITPSAPFVSGMNITLKPIPKQQANQPAVPAAAADTQRFYTVQTGDWLWKIARKFYGDATIRIVAQLREANRAILDESGALQPGQRLHIPPLSPPRQTAP